MHGTGGSIALVDGKLVRTEEPTRHAEQNTQERASGPVAAMGPELSGPVVQKPAVKAGNASEQTPLEGEK